VSLDWLKNFVRPRLSEVLVRPAGSKIEYVRDRHTGTQTIACPFEHVIVGGADAEAVASRLKQVRQHQTPLILGSPRDAGILLEGFELAGSTVVEEAIETARTLDLDAWISDRRAEAEAECYADSKPIPPRSPWTPDVMRQDHLNSVRDIRTREFHGQVIVALLPTDQAPHAAAHLRFGAWNDCPDPATHVAFAERWYRSNGAIPVVNTFDIIEFRVGRPISSRDEAIAIATEQFFYCTDIVYQGCQTLDLLAASLLKAPYWYFWWD
jgi:hypothetical protein